MKVLRSLHLIIIIRSLTFEKLNLSAVFYWNLFIRSVHIGWYSQLCWLRFPQLYNTSRNSFLYYKLIHFTLFFQVSLSRVFPRKWATQTQVKYFISSHFSWMKTTFSSGSYPVVLCCSNRFLLENMHDRNVVYIFDVTGLYYCWKIVM